MEIQLHPGLTSSLNEWEISFTRQLLYLRGKISVYSQGSRMYMPLIRSECCGENRSVPELEPRFPHPKACSLVTGLTQLCRLQLQVLNRTKFRVIHCVIFCIIASLSPVLKHPALCYTCNVTAQVVKSHFLGFHGGCYSNDVSVFYTVFTINVVRVDALSTVNAPTWTRQSEYWGKHSSETKEQTHFTGQCKKLKTIT